MSGEDAAYGALLRSAIEKAGSSRRKLSFSLAKMTKNKQPSEYRSLGKYLSGEEAPARERAAILAVLLSEPRLALVEGPRRGRLAELAATVERLEDALEDALTRLEALESRARPARRRATGGR